MDIEIARTLITVVEAGSFLAAAERLNVTQSTVSARIKELENQLGQRLLERGRHGARPTAAGRQLLRHAGVLVRVWQQARQELGLPESMTRVLGIGAQVSLWERLMSEWIGRIRDRHPELALRAELGSADALMRQVTEGTLDIAVVYTPRSGPGLVVRPLFNEELLMVSDRPDHEPSPGPDYVFCDWGPEFQADHARAFPDAMVPGLSVNAGTVGLAYVLGHGGAIYVPRRLAEPHFAAGRLFPVKDAPAFQRPAYVVHPRLAADDPVNEAIATITQIAGELS